MNKIDEMEAALKAGKRVSVAPDGEVTINEAKDPTTPGPSINVNITTSATTPQLQALLASLKASAGKLPRTAQVLFDVTKERERQEAKWGEQSHNHPIFSDGMTFETRPSLKSSHYHMPSAAYRRNVCSDKNEMRTLSWMDIFLEEVAELFEAKTKEEFRKEMIQLIAVGTACIEDIDREEA